MHTTYEERYSLAEARRIIARETEQRKAAFKRKLQQKLVGFFLLAISASEFALGYAGIIDEGGVSLIMIPMGLYLIFNRKLVI